ncbi:MAG: DUF3179 domain-containing protein [Acidimicrobiia bacterium]|nr:DUF3179 domain-containing protein [Acidimicrobiia bacterium]NNL27265.1 DUF3179 domain-containing protein [Acidimicrobiia bacterium]
MVHRRELKGTELVFGNQGDLYGNAMTWFDHGTGSIWSQPRGEAILGPLTGERLELLPSTLTTWQAWTTANPQTLALDVEGWPTGFHLEDMAVVVDMGGAATAYSFEELQRSGVVNDEVAGVPVAIVIDPQDTNRWAVFSRQLDDVVVELSFVQAGLIDIATGTSFDPFSGVGVAGPLRDQSLDRLPAFTAFPDDYARFFPAGTMWPG